MNLADQADQAASFDVAVIGAGVVGAALARAFTLAGAKVVVLEKGWYLGRKPFHLKIVNY